MALPEQPNESKEQLIEATPEGWFVHARNQDRFERYLQRASLGIAVDEVEKTFPDEKIVAYDPAAGIDRYLINLVDPQNCIIGNPYDTPHDMELSKKGVRFVEADFPVIPVEAQSVHLITLNSVDLFNPDFLDQDKAEETLANMHRAIKPGGLLLVTRGIEAQLDKMLEQKTHIQTYGRSVLLPKVKQEIIDWQRPTERQVRISDVYLPARSMGPDFDKLEKLGWKRVEIKGMQMPLETKIKFKGVILPSSMSIHKRKTLLENVTAGYNYPVFCFKAV